MLKPDFIKIDRKLVDNIGRNETNKEIIKTIAMVSKLLGTKLLAEGVETKEEL